ncbi:unnamed protein product [Brassica oleracea]|uniref:Uncharacterized protein n=2 Tax=Brassica TaxID=3705 RepID=A0ABQ7B7U4_BRACR|nr:hypothetical protein DY000_02036174 [Brassica cretica]CAF2067093.1 unnamed protein product [Brassica napus]
MAWGLIKHIAALAKRMVGSRERKYEAWSKGKKKLPEVEVDKEDKAKKEREAEALEDMMNWFERWRRRQ